MNLKGLREKIKNLIDYSPELQAFNDQLDELINDAYMYIWTMKRWSFGTKQINYSFYPDMLPSRDTLIANPINASVTKGSRRVTFSGNMDRLVAQVWEGQVIEIQGLEYIISKVLTGSLILLDMPFQGATNVDDESWRIKKRFYDLPEDFMELLNLAHRDAPVVNNGQTVYGKMQSIMPRRDEEYNLRMDYAASYAEGYVWSPCAEIPAAEKTVISNVVENQLIPPAGFPQSTYLEVCWCFEKDGKRGPLAEPATVSFPVEAQAVYNFDINFRSWDDQPIVADTYNQKDTTPTQYEGYRKVVFWNANYNRATGERLGLPCWVEFSVAGSVRDNFGYLDTIVVQDTEDSVSIINFSSIDPGNKRYREYDGQHLRIRPYPRIDGFDIAVSQQPRGDFEKVPQNFIRQGVMRYQYKPLYMTKITDSPELPYEFHQLIVYKALEDIYLKLGQSTMSNTYRKKIEAEIKSLERRYVDRVDTFVRRGQFGKSSKGYYIDASMIKFKG